MKESNWKVIRIYKKDGGMLITNISGKWSYKMALAIAVETTFEEFELICVIKEDKLISKNEEKKSEQKLHVESEEIQNV